RHTGSELTAAPHSVTTNGSGVASIASCVVFCACSRCLFFFDDPATTAIYTLSLHDALPISRHVVPYQPTLLEMSGGQLPLDALRSEEHTSELQSLAYLVCRLLLEKKNGTAHQCSIAKCSTPTSSRICRSSA